MSLCPVSFAQSNVLIIDDAQAVISAVRAMLRAMGFQDACIDYSKDGKSALNSIRSKKYDIIICDYNLGDGLNGKQLLEEMRYSRLLGPDNIFIMITGESSNGIVRSIVELRPDEYILKPFSPQQLQKRLKSSIFKKHYYHELYEIEHRQDAAAGIILCDELLSRGDTEHLLVSQFKGRFLQSLKLYDSAQQLYQELYQKHSEEWIKVELCNVLVELGNYDEVELLMSGVKGGKGGVTLPELSVMSKLEIYKGNIPEAISHLSLASILAPGNPIRELVIANLCLSEHDYVNAERKYSIYRECCKDTSRDDLVLSLNIVRVMLFSAELEAEEKERRKNIKK